MPNTADVSILIPSYKPEWFAQCLASCLNQSVPVKEIIVSDDCPTDEIEKIVEPYLADGRVKYVRNQPSLGLAANYLQLARMSTGKWLKFFDDDDLLHQQGVERLMAHATPDVALVMGGCRMLREDGEVREKREALPAVNNGMEYFLTTYRKIPVTLFSRMLVRRDVMEDLLKEDIPARMISLDELVGLRACLAGNVAWENEMVCDHRDFSGGYSRNAEPDVLIDDLAYVMNPFDHAVANGLAPKSKLQVWRTVMVRKYARGVITKFIQQEDRNGLWEFIGLLRERFGFGLALRCAFSPRLIVKYCKRFF